MSRIKSDYSFDSGDKNPVKCESNKHFNSDEAKCNLKPTKRINGSRRGPSPSSTFPAKLHVILTQPDLSHIISWMPHGRSWRVINPKLFADTVMTTYFEHQSKYSSFTRQVNGWGFKRITHGPDRNSYYHPLFIRDEPHLTRRMTRTSSSALSRSKKGDSTSGNSEPNFYELCGLRPPLPTTNESCFHYRGDDAQTKPRPYDSFTSNNHYSQDYYQSYYQKRRANYNTPQSVHSTQRLSGHYQPYHYQSSARSQNQYSDVSPQWHSSEKSSSSALPYTYSANSNSTMSQGFQNYDVPYVESYGYTHDREGDPVLSNQTDTTSPTNTHIEPHPYDTISYGDSNSDYWQTHYGSSLSNHQSF